MKNIKSLLYCMALTLLCLCVVSPTSAETRGKGTGLGENREHNLKKTADNKIPVLTGTWYIADAGQIVRLDFTDHTLTISGRDLYADSEEYLPFHKMALTMISDSQIELDVTAVAMPSEEDEGMVLTDRESYIRKLKEDQLLEETVALEYAKEIFNSVILNFSLEENGCLALAEDGDEPDYFLSEPPVIHPALEGSR